MSADSLAVVLTLIAIVLAALHVWYGFMLAKVFRLLGVEEWRAWGPIANEAEILRLGDVPRWSVIFLLIPVVSLYGLYLKATAVSRIGATFGRGPGTTVLGVVLPPVWATVLARVAPTGSGLEDRLGGVLEPRSGYAVAVSTPPPEADPEPQPPEPQPPEPRAPGTWIVPPPNLIPPAAPASEPPEPIGTDMPSQPWAPLGPPAPAAVEGETTLAGDVLDRTVVVNRQPLPTWHLVVEGGPTFLLSARTVVLGRKTAGSGAAGQQIEVPDPTRTMSKVHARLDLADDVWTITDLGATNGVIVGQGDGSDLLLSAGGSAVVTGRFLLGKVEMRLSLDADPGS